MLPVRNKFYYYLLTTTIAMKGTCLWGLVKPWRLSLKNVAPSLSLQAIASHLFPSTWGWLCEIWLRRSKNHRIYAFSIMQFTLHRSSKVPSNNMRDNTTNLVFAYWNMALPPSVVALNKRYISYVCQYAFTSLRYWFVFGIWHILPD